MTSMPIFGKITILSLNFVNFRVPRFHVSHLTHETFKLCLQNTLNMSKTARVYFGVLRNQFTGHPTEDPNEHLGRFLRMANTVKLNGVRPEVIKLHLFPFSLRDIAATWYESLPYGSVDILVLYLSFYLKINLSYSYNSISSS